jgi:hypothetical protein
MRKRIMFGAVGALVGMAVAPLVEGSLDLPHSAVFAGLGVIGLVLGSLASLFADVFLDRGLDAAEGE